MLWLLLSICTAKLRKKIQWTIIEAKLNGRVTKINIMQALDMSNSPKIEDTWEAEGAKNFDVLQSNERNKLKIQTNQHFKSDKVKTPSSCDFGWNSILKFTQYLSRERCYGIIIIYSALMALTILMIWNDQIVRMSIMHKFRIYWFKDGWSEEWHG